MNITYNNKTLTFNNSRLKIPNIIINEFFYLSGYDNGRIYKYNIDGTYTGQYISLLEKINEFGQIYYATFVRVRDLEYYNNKFYIIENLYDSIYEFDDNWNFTGNVYSVQSKETNPEGFCIDKNNGDVYVVGRDGDAVFYYNSSFVYQSQLYNLKTIDEYFNASTIRKGNDGNFYICDSFNDYIYIFDQTWAIIDTITTKVIIDPNLYGNNIYGIYQDSDNNWYGTDIDSDKVIKYNSNWEFIEIFVDNTLTDTGDSVISGIVKA